MAKKAHPHHAKPYEQKVAERNAAKRSMRSGGDVGSSAKTQMKASGSVLHQGFQQRKNP